MGLHHQRRPRLFSGALWGWTLGLGLTACHSIAGIDDRRVDPSLVDSGPADVPDAAEDGPSGNACSLAGEGDAAIRFVHVHPQNQAFDLCFRRADAPWTRLLKRIPPGCEYQGLRRAAATEALPVPAGTYDLRVVGPGPDCLNFQAGSDVTGVEIPAGRRLAVVFATKNQGDFYEIRTYLEHKERPGDDDRRSFRFMNLIATGETIDVGFVWSEAFLVHDVLPDNQRLAELGFGQAPTRQVTWPYVDEDGYLMDIGFERFGAALHDQPSAVATIHVPNNREETLNSPLYVFGGSDDYTFPIQILQCDEHRGDGRFADCKTSLPPLKEGGEIRVGAFAANLTGLVAADGTTRRKAIGERLSQLSDDGPDVLCLSEVASALDYAAIREATQEAFPYVAYVQHDRSTPFHNPEDLTGQKPALYDEYMNTAPCPSSEPDLLQAFTDMIECLRAKCSTEPGELGYVTGLDCLQEDCNEKWNDLRLQSSNARQQWRCLSCLEAGVIDSSSLSSIQDRCTSDPAGGWAFDGRSSDFILSRWPFVDNAVESWVLPSSYARRSIVRATVMTGTSTGVDIYCTSLGELGSSLGGGYPGIYGSWADEQLLQAKQLCEWVEQRSLGRQAVVAGKMNASDKHLNGQEEVIVSNGGEATIESLDLCLRQAVPEAYAPAFTECPPDTSCPPGLWTTRLYTYSNEPPTVLSTDTLFEGEQLSTSHGLMSRIKFKEGTNAPAR